MCPGVVGPRVDVDGDTTSILGQSGMQPFKESAFPVVPHVDSFAGDGDGFGVE